VKRKKSGGGGEAFGNGRSNRDVSEEAVVCI
jgi:hypothetical protein